MDISGELFNLSTTNGVNEAGLANTVSSYQAILLSFDELELRVLKECLTTNYNCDSGYKDILLEAFTFVVSDFGLGDSLLMSIELGNFLIEGVSSLGLRFLRLFS